MMRLLQFSIRLYQWFIAPVLSVFAGAGGCCRFEPSCSRFFSQAVAAHGAWRGSLLGVKRIARCHPWGGSGFDPVPPARSFGARPHCPH